MNPRGAGLNLVFLLTLGCSTTSTIARVNGPPIEGSIVGGSPDTIFVRSDDEREYEVRRDDISSIDYPGNVHAAVGGGVIAYGVLNIAVGLPKCNEQSDNKAAFCTGVFLPAAIGAGILIWGLIVHHGQTSAVDDMSRESLLPKPQLRPPERETRPLPATTVAPQVTPAQAPNPEPAQPVAPASTATFPPENAAPPENAPVPPRPPTTTP